MESLYRTAFEGIKEHKADKLAGRLNSIPVPFPRLAKRFPGWQRNTYSIFTANSGVGKTKMTKYFIVTSIMKFIQENPHINVRVRWYALEETKEEFARSFISTVMALKHAIRLSEAQLLSLGEFTVKEDQMKLIEEVATFLDTFMARVEVIDDISNPYGIWKDVRTAAAEHGEFRFTGLEKQGDNRVRIEERKVEPGEMFTHYVPDDPKEFVFIVTDNTNILSPEKDQTLWEAMRTFSKKYCLEYMRKKLKYHVINIQQQAAEKEKQEFTFKGMTIEEKLEPSLDGLGDCKATQRDADLVWGFFSPVRFGGIPEYEGYDITRLKDHFRLVKFLKDRRYGLANARACFYFDGATNVLNELPLAKDMDDNAYKKFGS